MNAERNRMFHDRLLHSSVRPDNVLRGLACLALAMSGALAGCFPNTIDTVCSKDPTSGSLVCQPATGSVANAALATGTAAAVYTATGCTVNGCQLPDRCNTQTKRCEPITCDESKDCPGGYKCALDVHLCR